MPNIDFEDIFRQLKDQVVELAKLTLKGFKDQAVADAHKALDQSKDKLAKWTKLLLNRDIDQQEFEWLVANQIGLLQMTALQQTILAKVKIDQFKTNVTNLIVDTIFDKVLG